MFPLPPFTNPPGLLSFEVWLSAPRLAADLAAFLAGTAYTPIRIAGDTLSVRPPLDIDEEIARAELGIYLGMWRRTHPSETAEVV